MTKMKIQDKMRATHTNRWSIVNTTRQQTVAEHSWAVAVIAEELIDRAFGKDDSQNIAFLKNETRKVAIYHDVAEAVIGDIPTPTKRRLKDQIKEIETELYDPGSVPYMISEIVKWADRIEALVFVTTHGQGRHADVVIKRYRYNFFFDLNKESIEIRTAIEGILEDLFTGDVML